MAKENEAKQMKEMAKMLHKAADAAEELADGIGNPAFTEEVIEEKIKEFAWALMKIQLISSDM